MTFTQSVKTCLGPKYFFKFRGRASRAEFWWFMCFILLVNTASSLLFLRLPPPIRVSASLVVSLLLLPANLGVTIRRLHDRNLSGYWILIPVVTLILWVLTGGTNTTGNPVNSLLCLTMCLGYLVILCMPSQPQPNRFGPVP